MSVIKCFMEFGSGLHYASVNHSHVHVVPLCTCNLVGRSTELYIMHNIIIVMVLNTLQLGLIAGVYETIQGP